jgi:hypothetical protein
MCAAGLVQGVAADYAHQLSFAGRTGQITLNNHTFSNVGIFACTNSNTWQPLVEALFKY